MRKRPQSGWLASVEQVTQDCHHVKFTARNGETYRIDLMRMYQQNLRSGNRRAVCRLSGKWFFDSAMLHKAVGAQHRHVPKWHAYPGELQAVLASMSQGRRDCLEAPGEEGRSGNALQQALRCPSGHPMEMMRRWNHSCNHCTREGTWYRCADRCNYDLCEQCSQSMHQKLSSTLPAVDSLLATAREAAPGGLRPQDARAACDAVLAPDVSPSLALGTLQALVRDQGFRFSPEDARRAALFKGSAALLQLVLCSRPQLQMPGFEIFDRRYPGVVLSGAVKACVKVLLARGARLGKSAPAGKLLRKVEADAFDAWAQRYLHSMASAGADVPDHVQHQILRFVG